VENTDWYLYADDLNYIYISKWADASVIGVKLVRTETKGLCVAVYPNDFPCILTILPVFDSWMREFGR
jgi:hypothetical protein